MKSEAVQLARINVSSQREKAVFDGGVKIAEIILSNPFMMLILANVTIELLQNIQIKSATETVPVYSGQSHVVERYEAKKVPLLSQALGSTIQTVMNTGAVLSSVASLAASVVAVKK